MQTSSATTPPQSFISIADPEIHRIVNRELSRGKLRLEPPEDRRKVDCQYWEEWKEKQTILTEGAFSHILAHQLQGAEVLNEVYYRDVITRNWVENDTLILLGDVMLQIEAKGGVAAMASPTTNFASHVRAIQDLVVKAYRQTKRFLWVAIFLFSSGYLGTMAE